MWNVDARLWEKRRKMTNIAVKNQSTAQVTEPSEAKKKKRDFWQRVTPNFSQAQNFTFKFSFLNNIKRNYITNVTFLLVDLSPADCKNKTLL
jgi:hypothetical protein